MKARSIHQPWANAILHQGKNVENRRWQTSHRGPLLIHASKSRASYDRQRPADWAMAGLILPSWEDLTKGAILGVVDVIDCVQKERDYFLPGHGPNIWVEGPWLWVLANPRAFENPVPFRGLQMLFDVDVKLLPELK
jgi:hypothetical protein